MWLSEPVARVQINPPIIKLVFKVWGESRVAGLLFKRQALSGRASRFGRVRRSVGLAGLRAIYPLLDMRSRTLGFRSHGVIG